MPDQEYYRRNRNKLLAQQKSKYWQDEEFRDRRIQARRENHDKLEYGGNKEKAFKRDKYTCQWCKGQSGNKLLTIHHIDKNGTNKPRHLRNNNLDNLLTLCNSCHTSLHMNR